MTVSELPDLNELHEPSLSDIELLVPYRIIPYFWKLDLLDMSACLPSDFLMNPSEEELPPSDLSSILEPIVTLVPPVTLHYWKA